MNRRSTFLALVVAIGLGACEYSATGSVSGSTTPVVYTEPPQPQVETISVQRPGHLWVKGRWDWRGGQWAWVGGHWERERSGYGWQEGHWERRGNAWHWVEGRWVQGQVTVVRDHRDPQPPDHGGGTPPPIEDDPTGDYPTDEPPAPQQETVGTPQKGHIWVAGRWEWKSGRWSWLGGHWERERANKAWTPGRWEKRGRRWVWVDGTWQ